QYTTPMLYAVGFIFLFLIGGLTGIPNAMTAIDLYIHDTHFVVAHFHYVMAVATTFAIFGSDYYLFPKMTGRMYSDTLGKLGFFILFAGVNITFFTMFIVGFKGMPRRYFDYQQFPQLEGLHHIITIGAYIIGIAALLILISWIHGLVAGKKATDNPWGSKSLEWTTSTPPPPGNFRELPILTEEWHPYGYGRSEQP
ncbi:MAG: cbb3-type cytochrome c oxidase subunit I, partial [Nitrospirota bacterium]|nr:cbb3-type cytochrome c oxidase subunit I [Nitrospirota bacterium]